MEEITVNATISEIEVKTKIIGKDGFVKQESTERNKNSIGTKRVAKEHLLIDRTDSKFTQKTHHVEEKNEDGFFELVHEHTDKFPAKRRKN